MKKFKGVLNETAVRFPNTDIWMDSCGDEELKYGLERGIVGATSNPIIVGSVVKEELSYWEAKIRKLIKNNSSMNEDEITWELLYQVGRERSKYLLPVCRKFKGKKGRLSIQVNAKYYRSEKAMLEQALILNSLGKNMQVKIPASAAGIKAMEEATYRGISINATVSFTVAQAVAVAEAVERGMKRREKEGLSCASMSPVCTIMIGRTDDWLKKWSAAEGLTVIPEALEWAGVAVIKEAYRIYRERGYKTRLLSAANRNVYHWSELVGGDLCQTINYKWQKRLNEHCHIPVEDNILKPVNEEYMKVLNGLSEFHKSFDEKGMKPEEFVNYGGFRDTITTFLQGYDDLVKLVRSYMV